MESIRVDVGVCDCCSEAPERIDERERGVLSSSVDVSRIG